MACEVNETQARETKRKLKERKKTHHEKNLSIFHEMLNSIECNTQTKCKCSMTITLKICNLHTEDDVPEKFMTDNCDDYYFLAQL